MKKRILSLLMLVGIFACNQPSSNKKTEVVEEVQEEIETDKVEDGIYSNDEIGWSIEVPEGWDIAKKEEAEDPADSRVSYVAIQSLLSFQKDEYNLFQSTIEPFEIKYEGEWQENERALKYVIYKTYEKRGIAIDTTATTAEEIDGVHFHTYSFRTSHDDEVIEQIMYRAPIKGYDFGVVINYNNEEDREELLSIFRSSKFQK